MTSNISAQPSLFGDPSIDHALAGLGAGTVATLVMHPLDLIKVRFQLADSKPHPNSHLPLHKTKPRLGTGVYMALKDAVVVDGWKGLYRGLVPNLVGGASSWGFYNMIKKQMQGGDPSYRTSSGQHLLAAAEASAITAMLTNPIWVVKTRVFGTAKHDSIAYRGLWDGLRSIYRTEGIRGLYKGSLLALVGVSNGSIQFATYEEIKRRRTDLKKRKYLRAGKEWKVEDEKLTNTEYILASGSSKLVAIALTYPYQVVRARIQNFSPTPTVPKLTIPSVISSIWRNEGALAMYKGLGTNALRILPGTCTTFVVYENLVWAFRMLAVKGKEKNEGLVA
ncbi:solute carrier family 25 (mitochondrial folate transporter), member 32 [Cryptococcus deuterogattii 99/473]|uniref:Solute carrier family 25 (Mitochondrial folate transporter), member 32 n=1 Tax=Cryptococcus deuterogattii Ram5 TaxID=1296110 RepID=A0A0D0U1Q6_9TREE|nr:solute carrier family 25 (mitochondrial folate transporter), member 32 [Cryptococcus deuterogattii LA55]KIR31625.1 solute carrier family 25 (mitochondrial folate transporter), member 32 [Cryptococcus deuterogattii MMRL2647]KIR42103.1 solute carrier family 25 (mitochondrial folate transporter), member 32 [Cryptococcus deuterogattii Ram5]KIR73072.1 solute carrier family 25 (mitochondrial folate transporter), member 32 [Cryptococcus deuterogattii CA1014]KIR90151.1 solute carrier family 25 (mito